MNKIALKNMFLNFIKTYLIVTFFSSLSMVILTLDFETIGVGLLAPIFIIPSIFLYILFNYLKPNKNIKDILFFIPVIILIIYLITLYLLDLLDIVSSDVWWKIFLGLALIFTISSWSGYYYLKRLTKN